VLGTDELPAEVLGIGVSFFLLSFCVAAWHDYHGWKSSGKDIPDSVGKLRADVESLRQDMPEALRHMEVCSQRATGVVKELTKAVNLCSGLYLAGDAEGRIPAGLEHVKQELQDGIQHAMRARPQPKPKDLTPARINAFVKLILEINGGASEEDGELRMTDLEGYLLKIVERYDKASRQSHAAVEAITEGVHWIEEGPGLQMSWTVRFFLIELFAPLFLGVLALLGQFREICSFLGRTLDGRDLIAAAAVVGVPLVGMRLYPVIKARKARKAVSAPSPRS